MVRAIRWFITLGLVLGLVLGGCAAPQKQAPAPAPVAKPAPVPAPQLGEWDKILAAAGKEGTVTVYNVLGTELSAALKQGGKKYGIKVDTIGGTGGELELRIVTEQRGKSYAADMLISGWTSNMSVLAAGYGEPVKDVVLPDLGAKDVWKISPSAYEPTKVIWAYGTSLAPTIIINTDLVRKGDIQSWPDLLDPRWRDKMVMQDPRTGSGPGTLNMYNWMRLGEDFWKGMAAQRITMQASYDLTVSQVAHGEKSVGIFAAYSRMVSAIKAGAPIQIVHLREGVFNYVNGVNLVKNGPHPNAALVLLNWMFSQEGQTAIGRATDNNGVRKDINENWLRIPELNSSAYTLLQPPGNISLANAEKGATFGKSIFGAR